MKGIVITTDKKVYTADFKNFMAIAPAMGWEMTEHVKAWGLPDPYCLLIDEEGLLKEHPEMNDIASIWYGYLVHGNPIVGTVVIMKDEITNAGPYIVGLSDSEVDRLTDMLTHTWPVSHLEDKTFE